MASIPPASRAAGSGHGVATPASARDQLFVVEADEYDKAFLALAPTMAIVNNVEADHLECYGSVEGLEAAFVTFASRARVAIVGVDDAGAARIASRLGNKVMRFGMGGEADARILDVSQRPDRTHARVRFPMVAKSG